MSVHCYQSSDLPWSPVSSAVQYVPKPQNSNCPLFTSGYRAATKDCCVIKTGSRRWCSVLFSPPGKGLSGSLLLLQQGAVAVKGAATAPVEGYSCSDGEIVICPKAPQSHGGNWSCLLWGSISTDRERYKHIGPENFASVSHQKIPGSSSCKGKYNQL